jgi:hypothetical protein
MRVSYYFSVKIAFRFLKDAAAASLTVLGDTLIPLPYPDYAVRELPMYISS